MRCLGGMSRNGKRRCLDKIYKIIERFQTWSEHWDRGANKEHGRGYKGDGINNLDVFTILIVIRILEPT